MEKQNKATRQKRKKEETTRIRTLVGRSSYHQNANFFLSKMSSDTAYSLDPRIKRFRGEEKAEKEARKRARAEAARQEADEKERVSLIINRQREYFKNFTIVFSGQVLYISQILLP